MAGDFSPNREADLHLNVKSEGSMEALYLTQGDYLKDAFNVRFFYTF